MLGLGRDPRITGTGLVPDLGSYTNQATVVIVPLRRGACIRMKVSLPRAGTAGDSDLA
jgi:hypothetical protein